MILEGRIHCEAPDCDTHTHLGPDRFNETGKITSLPPGFVRLTWYGGFEYSTYVFCSTDCAMKWCAQHEPPEIIPFEDVA